MAHSSPVAVPPPFPAGRCSVVLTAPSPPPGVLSRGRPWELGPSTPSSLELEELSKLHRKQASWHYRLGNGISPPCSGPFLALDSSQPRRLLLGSPTSSQMSPTLPQAASNRVPSWVQLFCPPVSSQGQVAPGSPGASGLNQHTPPSPSQS